MTTSTTNNYHNIQQISGLVEYELKLVEDLLRSNLIDNFSYINSLLNQIFQSGGKRIRPLLALLASKGSSCFNDNYFTRNHLIHACLSELIHTASLVHDDVIDNSDLRRGHKTLNYTKSDKLAVLMGDLLFAQASVCLSRLMEPQIVGIYGQVLGDLCSGEIKQMSSNFNPDIDIATYIEKSICKTATLFKAACLGGPIINHVSPCEIMNYGEFGLNLGICFQIVDDILDIIGNTKDLGKPQGNDLINGVITLPIIYVLQDKNSDSDFIRNIISTKDTTNIDNLEKALKITINNNGVARAINLAQEYADNARKNLSNLPDNIYTKAQQDLIDIVMNQIKI